MTKDRTEDVVDIFKPPERYWKSRRSLENFNPRNPGQRYALNYVMSMEDDPKTGLYIYGGTGRGKTHFLIGVARKYRAAGKEVSYVTSSELWDYLGKYSEFNVDEAEPFLHNKILIVDDLQFRDDRSEFRKLHGLVNYAYDANKRLFISSLHSPHDVGRAMRKAKLSEQADQMLSRLIDSCEIANFGQGDERLRQLLEKAKKDLGRKRRFLM